MSPHEINEKNNFICGWTTSSAALCDELVAYFEGSSAKTAGVTSSNAVKTQQKQSTDIAFTDALLLNRYVDEILQPCANMYIEKYPSCNLFAPWKVTQYPNIQHYKKGEAYHAWHTERVSDEPVISSRHLVFITYLNDVYDAGETEFFHQQCKVQPRKGLTLLWPADWTFLHRGVPSMTEEKYIVTGWYNYVK